ncbi:MAG: hypothetical protein U9Q63_03495 [Patescibacteria group bacterium]|nr:hypothetical protein [Patescibacteria group bacterium]
MRKILTFITMLTLSFFLIGCNNDKTTTTDKTTTDTNTTETTTLNPSRVVELFMRATLGTVPGALIDYDLAKTLMTTSYAAEFTTPMFVPQSYAIQDGPDSYEITNEEVLTDTATVTVLGHWGTENQMYWMFELEKENKDWKLNFINPGQ